MQQGRAVGGAGGSGGAHGGISGAGGKSALSAQGSVQAMLLGGVGKQRMLAQPQPQGNPPPPQEQGQQQGHGQAGHMQPHRRLQVKQDGLDVARGVSTQELCYPPSLYSKVAPCSTSQVGQAVPSKLGLVIHCLVFCVCLWTRIMQG